MPAHPVFRPNKTALITGSASGIGLAVAKLCHNHGMRLALVDNNAKDLEQAKEFFANDGRSGEVEIYEMDVSKVEEWKGLKEKVLERFGGVDFLMLNAGIGTKGEWEDEGYFHKVSLCSIMVLKDNKRPLSHSLHSDASSLHRFLTLISSA